MSWGILLVTFFLAVLAVGVTVAISPILTGYQGNAVVSRDDRYQALSRQAREVHGKHPRTWAV